MPWHCNIYWFQARAFCFACSLCHRLETVTKAPNLSLNASYSNTSPDSGVFCYTRGHKQVTSQRFKQETLTKYYQALCLDFVRYLIFRKTSSTFWKHLETMSCEDWPKSTQVYDTGSYLTTQSPCDAKRREGGTKVQLNGKQLPHDGLAERILIRKGDSTSGLETR